MLDGGIDFSYAVYDEVHSLDGDEGAALQRLMTGVSCPFLALSATIGNGDALRSWCQKLRNAHGDAAPAGDGPDDPRHCNLVEHEGRFINLQRYVWDDAGCITPLHPCAAMSVASVRCTSISLLFGAAVRLTRLARLASMACGLSVVLGGCMNALASISISAPHKRGRAMLLAPH